MKFHCAQLKITTCRWLITLTLLVQSNAASLLPDRSTQILIEGSFPSAKPEFLLIFSTRPLLDSSRNPVSRLTKNEAIKLADKRDCAVVQIGAKESNGSGCAYHFGPGEDKDRPWNNGAAFKWESWGEFSPDIWDNLAIICLPEKGGGGEIRKVVVRLNDQLLYDSSLTQSYPNKQSFEASFPPYIVAGSDDKLPVLNLSDWMARFRDAYYELGGNPILTTAYADLGQTDKSKYANRGTNWCSEFATHVYRQNGIRTPDPNAGDVHFENIRDFFKKHGDVYPAREVAGWSSQKKLETILPGSFVSILTGDASTHSIFFTGWVRNSGNDVSQYVGISGNNKNMVWRHAPMSLPQPGEFEGMTVKKLREIDDKVFFAVPRLKSVMAAKDTIGTEGKKAENGDDWRTWTTVDGRFAVEARLVSIEANGVILQKRNGQTITVKPDILRAEDRAYISKARETDLPASK